jgi:hypothetical protein
MNNSLKQLSGQVIFHRVTRAEVDLINSTIINNQAVGEDLNQGVSAKTQLVLRAVFHKNNLLLNLIHNFLKRPKVIVGVRVENTALRAVETAQRVAKLLTSN